DSGSPLISTDSRYLPDDAGDQGRKMSYDFVVEYPSSLYPSGYPSGGAWPNEITKVRYMFCENASMRGSDVRDGLSNTIAMCERTLEVDPTNGACTAWMY